MLFGNPNTNMFKLIDLITGLMENVSIEVWFSQKCLILVCEFDSIEVSDSPCRALIHFK